MKTREEIEAMSHEVRRIKTAELCGWMPYGSPDREEWMHPDGCSIFQDIPDYLQSLDAMHEAELILSAEIGSDLDNPSYSQSMRYSCHLMRLVSRTTVVSFVPTAHLTPYVTATARQRNTAFLMTMLP